MNTILESVILYLKSNKVIRWLTATRLRRFLSGTLAVLMFITSIRYIFIKPKEVAAADIYIGLNEGYGTTSSANDTNSTVAAGTVSNAVWKTEDLCKTGKCLYFDGNQDYVSFADDSDLDFAGADSFTLNLWFRHIPKTAGIDVMINKLEDVGTDGGYEIQMEFDGDITCQIEDDDADTTIDDLVTSTAATYDDNQWHFVSCVKSGTTSLTLYIDGVQVAQDASLNASSTLANGDTFYIGMDGDGTSNDYTGFIDEVKVYRSARTGTEIKADFTGETPSRGTSASFGPNQDYVSNGLMGYWKMDESSGNMSDSSGNGGTLTNNASATFTVGKFANGSEYIPASSQYFSGGETLTYYFDGSDAGATDPNNVWTSDSLAFNSSSADGATTTTIDTGTYTSNYLMAEGTNAPASGGTISSVQVRTYGGAEGIIESSCDLQARVYTNSLSETLGTLDNPNSSSTPGWSSYWSLNTPTGGWDWSKVQSLEIRFILFDDSGETCSSPYAIANMAEILVTTSGPAPLGVKTVSFWTNPDSNTNYYVSLTSGAYITSSSGTLSATGFTNPKIFVNGVETTTVMANVWQFVTVTTDAAINADTFYVGRQGNNYYDGTLDELRIYNRALSPTEISKLYNWAPGPVGYWKLDENTGTDTNDSSGNGYSGVITNGTNIWKPCKFGSCIETTNADGLRERTDVSDNPALDFTGIQSFSLSAWVKYLEKENSSFFLIYKGADSVSSPGYNLEVTSGSKFACNYTDGNGSGMETATSTTSVDTNYHFVSCVMDRIGATGVVGFHIFVDGKLEGSDTTLTEGDGSSTQLFIIGETDSAWEFTAAIDDVKLYNYPRSSSQIIEDMNAGHPAPGSPVGSALGYWKMDEGASDTCSGGANDICNSGSQRTTLDGAFGATTAAPTYTNSGKFGKGLTLDGSNDVVSLGSATAIDNLPASGMTISTWIYPTSVGENSRGIILAKNSGATPSSGWILQLVTTNAVKFSVDGSTDLVRQTSDSAVTLNAWNHVVLTWDGVITTAASADVYINGQEVSYATTTDGATRVSDAGSTMYLGNDSAGSSTFAGIIDETKVYNFGLTANQIKVEYNQGSNASMGAKSTTSAGIADNSAQRENCPPGNTETNCGSGDPSPVAEFRMDEGTGTTTTDVGGNSIQLSFVNSPTWDAGKYGSGIRINGDNNYIDVIDNDLLDMGTGSFSMFMWTNILKTASTDDIVFSKGAGNSTSTGYELMIDNTTGYLYFWISDGSSYIVNQLTGTTNVGDGKWHYIGFTWNPAVGVKMYVDGLVQNSAAITSSVDFNSGTNFQIGGYGGTNFSINGVVDNSKAYPYERTPSQIAWDMNHGAPVGWWKLDENTGTAANDSSGFSNTGTLTNTPTWTTGKYNYAVSFAGSNQHITRADDPDFDFLASAPFSISAWFKHGAASATETLVSKIEASGTDGGYKLKMESDGDITCETDDDDADTTIDDTATTTAATYDDGNWHHVVCVYDTANTDLNIYIDGVLAASDTTTTTNSLANDDALFIGIEAATGTEDWIGQIDDVRIYAYPINSTQVRTLFNENSALRFGPASGTP